MARNSGSSSESNVKSLLSLLLLAFERSSQSGNCAEIQFCDENSMGNEIYTFAYSKQKARQRRD